MVNTPPAPPLHGQITDGYALCVEEFDGDPDKVDALTCELCRTPVGLATGDGATSTRHVMYYAVHLQGDTVDTLFCEDCAGWLTEAAPLLTAPTTTTTTTTRGDLS